MKYILDTHVWLWWNNRPDGLSPKVRKLLSSQEQEDEFLISAISVWEFCKLLEKKRYTINVEPKAWIKAALSSPGHRLAELTPEICLAATTLPAGIHNDPVDQIIAATARVEDGILITKDERLTRYPHVRTIW